MTPEQIDLAKRLTACRGFKWLDGTRLFALGRSHPLDRVPEYRDPVRLTRDGWTDDVSKRTCLAAVAEADAYPDLNDPPTVAQLLAQVRVLSGNPYAFVRNIAPAVRIGRSEYTLPVWSCDIGPGPTFHAPTEGEAVALALLSLLTPKETT